MPIRSLSASDLKALVAAELRKRSYDDVDADALVILTKESGWWAALRRDGRGLVDEARHAAVAEASRRLSRGFALDPAAV